MKEIAKISIQSDGMTIKAVMSEPFNEEAEGRDFSDALRNLANEVEQKFHRLRFNAGLD